MLLIDKEHYELIKQFENDFKYININKEPKEIWKNGSIYENGETNKMFLAYRLGYSLGKAIN